MVFNYNHKLRFFFQIQSSTSLKPLKVYLPLKILKFRLQPVLLQYQVILSLQVPTKIFRNKPVPQNYPKMSEKCAFNDNSFDATNHQFQFQNFVALLFSQFKITQRGTLQYISFNHQKNNCKGSQLWQISQRDETIIQLCWIQSLLLVLHRQNSSWIHWILLKLAHWVVLTKISYKPIQNRLLLQIHFERFMKHLLLRIHANFLWKFTVIIFCSHNESNEPFPCNHIKIYCTFIALDKHLKTFDWTDNQYTPKEYLDQNDARLIFIMGEVPPNPVHLDHWRKTNNIYTVLFIRKSLRLFFGFVDFANWRSQKFLICFCISSRKTFSSTNKQQTRHKLKWFVPPTSWIRSQKSIFKSLWIPLSWQMPKLRQAAPNFCIFIFKAKLSITHLQN